MSPSASRTQTPVARADSFAIAPKIGPRQLGAVFYGSFDPFTNGHFQVYLSAKRFFNSRGIRLDLGIVRSTMKTPTFDRLEDRAAIIRSYIPAEEADIYLGESRQMVKALKEQSQWVVKGRRNQEDQDHSFDVMNRVYQLGTKKLVQFDAHKLLSVISSSELKALVGGGHFKAARTFASDAAVDALVERFELHGLPEADEHPSFTTSTLESLAKALAYRGHEPIFDPGVEPPEVIFPEIAGSGLRAARRALGSDFDSMRIEPQDQSLGGVSDGFGLPFMGR